MRPLTIDDVRPGLPVVLTGPPLPAVYGRDADDLFDHEVPTGHPGRIEHWVGPGRNHVVVHWLGLEDDARSIGEGHDPVDGVYPMLGVPGEAEWCAAVRRATGDGDDETSAP